jgi:glycosyltransferase involved in cell wall biosynthesis
MDEPLEQTGKDARLKIVFICGAGTVSGREIATLNLIAGLRERGHEVHCISTTWGDGLLAERLRGAGVPHISLPLGFISKTLSWSAILMTLDQLRRVPRLWLGFRRYLREVRPDLVVQTNFHHVFLLWPLLNPRNTLFQVHDDFPQTKFYRRLFGFLNRRLCAFMCVSRYIARSVMSLGIQPEKVCTVYNGIIACEPADGNVRVSAVEDKRAGGETRKASAVTVGIVGQIGEWKGHDDLIEALRELKEDGLKFSCAIFGDGEARYLDALQEKISAYQLTDRIRWEGFVKNPSEIYGAIDICVVPSRVNEAFGMVAAEAGCFGLPVIATRLGALPEIVRDGETGYLVEGRAPRQLAEKLRLLISDAALRKSMGKLARSFAAQQFRQERTAEQAEITFARLLEPGAVAVRKFSAAVR